MITIIVLSLSIILCLVLSAFFSGSEMAFSSANTVRLENLKDKGNKKAQKALKITENFDKTLSTILIGNNLVNIAASSIGSVLVILILGPSYSYISTIVITVLVVIFGETIPKITSKKIATTRSMNYAGFTSFLMVVFKPLVALTVWLVNLLTKNITNDEEEEDSEESVEELQSIIETAEDEGIIDSEDSELMINAIDFYDVMASEVMTARVDVQAIDIDDSWENIISFINSTPYSRIPVYKDSIDNIIGILHLNRFFAESLSHNNEAFDIETLLLKPCYVYKTMKLPSVLRQLRESKQHLAIVTDEYSGTLGIVTLEDVMENLVGEIWDETDVIEDDIVEKKENVFEVDGNIPISEFLELTEISEDDFEAESETVGGWCIEVLDRFPKPGDSFTYEDLTIKVISMDGLRVEKLLITKQ